MAATLEGRAAIDVLKGCRILIVLDDVDHAIPHLAEFFKFISSVSKATILLTAVDSDSLAKALHDKYTWMYKLGKLSGIDAARLFAHSGNLI